MSSLLSLLSSSLNAVDLYAQLYKDEDFVKLVNNCADKSVNNIIRLLVHKFAHMALDMVVGPVLLDKSLDEIFELANVTQENKVKMYVGKAVLLINDTFLKDNGRIVIDPQILVGQAVLHILDVVDADTVHSGADIYKQLIVALTDNLCTYLNPAATSLTSHVNNPDQYALFLSITKQVIQFVNLVIGYNSPFDKDDNDDDDNDDDGDSEGTWDNDGNSADDESGDDESGKVPPVPVVPVVPTVPVTPETPVPVTPETPVPVTPPKKRTRSKTSRTTNKRPRK